LRFGENLLAANEVQALRVFKIKGGNQVYLFRYLELHLIGARLGEQLVGLVLGMT
jgi:hypothetical protein